MKLQKRSCALISGIALTFSPAVHAATLATFDWNGGAENGNANGFTPDTAAGFSVTALSGFNYQTNAGYFNGTSGARHTNVARSTSGTLRADTSSFTTSGTAGQTISYESFSGLFSDNNADYRIDLSYSIGGATAVAAGTFNPTAGSPLDASGSAFDFADFSTDQAVVWTFTFTNLNNANDRMRFDDWDLTGTVPEPSSVALLGLGGAAMLLRRRR